MSESTLEPTGGPSPETLVAPIASQRVLSYASPESAPEATRLGELSPAQIKSGLAAWLGWLFDGLDMHLYTIVAAPFVATLMNLSQGDDLVKKKSALIQASFLIGWALGGAFFGRLGDILGRSKSLALTILTYASFTGLAFFAHTWWQLMIFRFVAALGIGGEWAVGSSLLSETWPKKWRPWIAAVLQTGVNLGVLLAAMTAHVLAGYPKRYVFLVGVMPALIVYWIRHAVPEPAEWHEARANASGPAPRLADLFTGPARRVVLLCVIVCACSLTGWWGFMFWINQHWFRLPEVALWPRAQQERLASDAFFGIIGISILGNFFAGWLAKRVGYRRGIAIMCLGMFISMFGGFIVPRDHVSLMPWALGAGFFSGLFGLFTMYLPPLFPVLLRTTGAGFSYNIGRIAAAGGTILFGYFAKVNDLRPALLIMGCLLIPAAITAWCMPDMKDTQTN